MKFWAILGFLKKKYTSGFPKSDPEEIPLWTTTPVRSGTKEVTCPANAIDNDLVDIEKCISCGYCREAFTPDGILPVSRVVKSEKAFRKSFHVYLFDSGSCGACNSEVKALSNPYYDMSRLGISFAATPKHADALLVAGVLSQGMMEPLRKAVEMMPAPRLVFAIGACAITGGIIGESISSIVDADVMVPGCPPNPYTILDALQRAREAGK